MPKFFCDYCDVYLTHDSQSGRKQHNRGRKHQENVRMFYTAFLRTHTLVDPTAHIFAPIPKDKHGRDLVKPALPPPPGERPAAGGRHIEVGEGEGLAAYGIGQGGALAAVLPGPVLLIQPSTIPPLRDVEPLKEEDIMPLVVQHQSPTIPINVPAPPSMRPGGGLGYQQPPPPPAPHAGSVPPSPSSQQPLLPLPPFRSLPPPPFPRPPPPPGSSAPPASYPPQPQPPSPAAAASSGWNAAPQQRPPPPSAGYGPPANGTGGHPPPPAGAPRGPAINPERMRALGLHGLQ